MPSGQWTVKFPGGYSMSDPGVMVDIYSAEAPSITTYLAPGPGKCLCTNSISTSALTHSFFLPTTAVWSPGGTPPQPTSAAPTSVTATPTTSATPTPTPSSPGGTVPLWGQCGGIGYTGPTQCASGTCTAQSEYYSQCIP